MGKIIAVSNQKGGVGKTTTAINVSACLAEKGKRILAIDLDPQGNLTNGFGLDPKRIDNTIYDLIINEADIKTCIYKDALENLDVLPSNIDLAATEIELLSVDNKEFVLKDKIESLRNAYDYLIIDCPPSLNLLTINAMTTADSVLVPIQCEYYALEGLTMLISTINIVKERLNSELRIEGIVFTMCDMRTNLAQQVIENVKGNLTDYIFDTVIPRNVRLAEAPSYGMPISIYDPKSAGAVSYMELADELLKKGDLE